MAQSRELATAPERFVRDDLQLERPEALLDATGGNGSMSGRTHESHRRPSRSGDPGKDAVTVPLPPRLTVHLTTIC